MLDRRIAPPAKPLTNSLFPKVIQTQLSNGIPVWLLPWGQQEWVEVSVIFPAGRSFESAPGIAALTSEMMPEGTDRFTGLQFAQKLDEFGAFVSCDAGFESGEAMLTTLTRHLPSTLPLLAEQILRPSFPENEMEKLRQRILQHMDVEEQKTSYIAGKEFGKLLFGPGHPYGTATEKKDIERITREDLVHFHQKYWHLGNAHFLVVGKFDPKEMLGLLEGEFGGKGNVNGQWRVDPGSSLANKATLDPVGGFHYFEKADSMQATLRVGHLAFPRVHEDYYPMQVVSTLLGGYFGSRLMKNIREEKGYTYGIHSAWSTRKYAGSFIIQTDIGNAYIEPTLKEIDYEVNLLLNQGVDRDELELVQNYMIGRGISGRETPSQLGEILSHTLVNGVDLSDLDKRFDAILSMTPQSVLDMCQKHLHPDRFIKVVCGKMEK